MKSWILILFTFSFMAESSQAFDSGIPHFLKVRDGLYRGGRPNRTGMKTLKRLGVQTVIDLQGGDLHSALGGLARYTERGELQKNIDEERRIAESLGMSFHHFPLDSIDPINSNEALWIRQILILFKTSTNGPIFIHCQHGTDRTGLLIALERVFLENWSPRLAHREWISLGHSGIQRALSIRLDLYFQHLTQ